MTWLMRTWNVYELCFVIVDHRLTIDVDDIYFLTGLSHWGDDLSLFGSREGGGTTNGYLRHFCRGALPKDGRMEFSSSKFYP